MNEDSKDFEEENVDNVESNDTEKLEQNKDQDPIIDEKPSIEDEYAALKDRNLRLFAEFENFKKRSSKEKLELYKTANQSLLKDLLPVVDDFDRGMNQLKTEGDQEALKGMELIYQKFQSILKDKGLQAMEVAKGDDFDVENHEAITQVDVDSDDLKGKIVDVVETGYILNDKVIRYAKVVVGK